MRFVRIWCQNLPTNFELRGAPQVKRQHAELSCICPCGKWFRKNPLGKMSARHAIRIQSSSWCVCVHTRSLFLMFHIGDDLRVFHAWRSKWVSCRFSRELGVGAFHVRVSEGSMRLEDADNSFLAGLRTTWSAGSLALQPCVP